MISAKLDSDRDLSNAALEQATQEIALLHAAAQAVCAASAAATKDLKSALKCQERMERQEAAKAKAQSKRTSLGSRTAKSVDSPSETPKKAKVDTRMPIFQWGCAAATCTLSLTSAEQAVVAPSLGEFPFLFRNSDALLALQQWPQGPRAFSANL